MEDDEEDEEDDYLQRRGVANLKDSLTHQDESLAIFSLILAAYKKCFWLPCFLNIVLFR
jgi:hypothetical protein